MIAGATRPWNAAAFALAPNLTVISRVGVGYDNVNVADAHAAGVIVCNAPLAPMVSTAEHTMALLLAVTKHLPHQMARAARGLKGEPIGRALELDGRVLGLVGIGRIASRVAVAAQALGLRVIATDPGVDESPVPGVDLVGFHELLAMSDIVSLHAPALTSTIGMIDADALERMQPGSYLVNCAQRSLVDHDALVAALDAGHLAGRRPRRDRPGAAARGAPAARPARRDRDPARRVRDGRGAPPVVRTRDRQRARRPGRAAGLHRRSTDLTDSGHDVA